MGQNITKRERQAKTKTERRKDTERERETKSSRYFQRVLFKTLVEH